MIKTRSPLKRTALKPKRNKHEKLDAVDRHLCRARAEYRCEFCGRFLGNTGETHHVVKKSQSLDLRHDPRNHVYLCGFNECHDHNKEREMWHRFRAARPIDCEFLLVAHPLARRWFE